MRNQKRFLKKNISGKSFIRFGEESFVTPLGDDADWIFDFRRILSLPAVLKSVADIFWREFSAKTKFQIGCLEAAGIPLATALAIYGKERGINTSAFYIKKSRKETGLMRVIEGNITDKPVVLVDDIMSSGKSFIRQIEILESVGKKVIAVFSVLRFYDKDRYTYFKDKGIPIYSVFDLNDLSDVLPVKNLEEHQKPAPAQPFEKVWYFRSEGGDAHNIVQKSAPVFYRNKLFFGSDSGNFWAVDAVTGKPLWSFKVRFGSGRKYILSSPAVMDNLVYFGAYDGNVYALNVENGKKVWVYRDADWIGSSPALSRKHNLLFIGLEFGLFTRRGGVAALDAKTGERKWFYPFDKEPTHSSPAYSVVNDLVLAPSNDGQIVALNPKTGKEIWKFETSGAIRSGVSFSDGEKLCAFGSFDNFLYILEARTGKLVSKFETLDYIYSTPVFYGDVCIVGSADKIVYVVRADTGELIWKFKTGGRIFSSGVIIDGLLYVGSNDGRLYEIDPNTGKNTAFFQSLERIVNKIAYDSETRHFFVPTSHNELYCLERKGD